MRFLLFIALALLPLSAAIECWVGSKTAGSDSHSNKQCSGSFCSYVHSGGTITWSCGNQCSQTGCTNGPAKRDTVITGAGAGNVKVQSTETQHSTSVISTGGGPSAPVVTTTCCCAYAKCNLSKESAEAPAPANSGGHGSHGGNANTANGPSASAESDSAAAPALLLTAAATAAIVGARL